MKNGEPTTERGLVQSMLNEIQRKINNKEWTAKELRTLLKFESIYTKQLNAI